MRIDQWIWAVRLFKTRALAAEAIKGSHVKVNGSATKPAHAVKPGELVTVRIGIMTRTLRVLDSPRSRVSAKLVGQFAADLTPPGEYDKQRDSAISSPGMRPKGAGRPTKRDRRLLEGFAEE
jgi:ribosome-associated heat shock protein Hsp15